MIIKQSSILKVRIQKISNPKPGGKMTSHGLLVTIDPNLIAPWLAHNYKLIPIEQWQQQAPNSMPNAKPGDCMLVANNQRTIIYIQREKWVNVKPEEFKAGGFAIGQEIGIIPKTVTNPQTHQKMAGYTPMILDVPAPAIAPAPVAPGAVPPVPPTTQQQGTPAPGEYSQAQKVWLKNRIKQNARLWRFTLDEAIAVTEDTPVQTPELLKCIATTLFIEANKKLPR